MFSDSNNGKTDLCFRQLDLAPFDLLFWPHPLVIHHSTPGPERNPATRLGRSLGRGPKRKKSRIATPAGIEASLPRYKCYKNLG
jgi:hypothetical protein